MNISQHHLVTLKKLNPCPRHILLFCRTNAKQLEIIFLLDWNFTADEAARIPFDPIKIQHYAV